MKKKLTWR